MVISYKSVAFCALLGYCLSCIASGITHQGFRRQVSTSLQRSRRSPTSDLIAFSYMMSQIKPLIVRGLRLFEELHNKTKTEIQATMTGASDSSSFTQMLTTNFDTYGKRRAKLEDDLLMEVSPVVEFALPGVDVGSLRGLWEAFLGTNIQQNLLNYLQSINGTDTQRSEVISSINTQLDKELTDVQERLVFVESILENQQYEMRLAFKPDPRVVGVPSGLLGSTTSAS